MRGGVISYLFRIRASLTTGEKGGWKPLHFPPPRGRSWEPPVIIARPLSEFFFPSRGAGSQLSINFNYCLTPKSPPDPSCSADKRSKLGGNSHPPVLTLFSFPDLAVLPGEILKNLFFKNLSRNHVFLLKVSVRRDVPLEVALCRPHSPSWPLTCPARVTALFCGPERPLCCFGANDKVFFSKKCSKIK